MWFAEVGNWNPPMVVVDEVKHRQRKFFEEHPERADADPDCYRDILKKHRILMLQGADVLQPAALIARRSVMCVAKRRVALDVHYSTSE